MTGLSEQAKELHMMMGRRKPSEIQAVLNTRYWKNTEKTIKRTVVVIFMSSVRDMERNMRRYLFQKWQKSICSIIRQQY